MNEIQSEEKLYVHRNNENIPLYFFHFWKYDDSDCADYWLFTSNLLPLLEKAEPDLISPVIGPIGNTASMLNPLIDYLKNKVKTIELIEDYFLDLSKTSIYSHNIEACSIAELMDLRYIDSGSKIKIPYTLHKNKSEFIHARSEAYYRGIDCYYEVIEFNKFSENLTTFELQEAFAEVYQKNMIFLFLKEDEKEGYAAFDEVGKLQFFVITSL